MEIDNTSENKNPSQNKNRKITKIIIITLVVLALMAASSYLTYFWQHREVSALKGKLTSSSEKVDFMTKQRDGLNDQLASLSAENAELIKDRNILEEQAGPVTAMPPAQPDSQLDVSVIGARKYPDPAHPQANRLVVVDVAINNKGIEKEHLLISDFQISDEFNNTSVNFGTLSGKAMSNGLFVLDSREISPGETIKGAMIFSTLNEPAGYFTLKYKSQTYKITLE